MREILFRGKRIDNGEWIEGFYCQTADESNGGAKVKHVIVVPTFLVQKGFLMYEVDPSTIGQYTGLTDKNGKKIFEGDIVHYRCSDVIAEVKIGEYRDTESRKDAYGCYAEFVEDDQIVQEVMNHLESNKTYGCEVICNIHDNSELLEDKL